jgi:hypothetical protein
MSHRCPIIGGKRCPEKADKDGGCPAWVPAVLESNSQTGEERIVSDCVLRILPRWLLQGYGQTEGVRGELSEMRNAVVSAVAIGVEKAIESGNPIHPKLIGSKK